MFVIVADFVSAGLVAFGPFDTYEEAEEAQAQLLASSNDEGDHLEVQELSGIEHFVG